MAKRKPSKAARPQVPTVTPATAKTDDRPVSYKIPSIPFPTSDPIGITWKRELEKADREHTKRLAIASTDAEKHESYRQYKLDCETASNKHTFLRIQAIGKGFLQECSRRASSISDLLATLARAEDAIRNGFFPLREFDFGFESMTKCQRDIGLAALETATNWVLRSEVKGVPAKNVPAFNEAPETVADVLVELGRLRRWARKQMPNDKPSNVDKKADTSGHKSGHEKKSQEISRPDTPGFNEFDRRIREIEATGSKPIKTKVAQEVATTHGIKPDTLLKSHRRFLQQIRDSEK